MRCRWLATLRVLSLRRCMFLQGDFLPALAPALAGTLRSLDLAGCGLTLHLRRWVQRSSAAAQQQPLLAC